jgi:hypothetical protein
VRAPAHSARARARAETFLTNSLDQLKVVSPLSQVLQIVLEPDLDDLHPVALEGVEQLRMGQAVGLGGSGLRVQVDLAKEPPALPEDTGYLADRAPGCSTWSRVFTQRTASKVSEAIGSSSLLPWK